MLRTALVAGTGVIGEGVLSSTAPTCRTMNSGAPKVLTCAQSSQTSLRSSDLDLRMT